MKRVCLLLILCLCMLTAALPGCALADYARSWYEIFVRSYYDSDGDGIGDLAGVMEKLDYIEEMGYDGIWLMPVMPSPSYHKYDVTDYMAIDPQYGTLEDMRALVDACHARGIVLIIDMVLNHSSAQHPWFTAACEAISSGDMDHPYIDYYCFTQKPALKHVPVGETGYYYEEQFEGGGMPDLNLESEAVFAEFRDIFEFWLCDVGVDGFRLDAVTSFCANNTLKNVEILTRISDMAKSLAPDCYLIGEAWTNLQEIGRYYESGVDSFFLFPVSQAEGSLARALRARKPAEAYKSCIEEVYAAIPDGLIAPFLGNHDTGRALVSVQGRSSLPKAKFAQGILGMMGGAAFTYYGDEIGMVGSGDDPNKRLAMYWNDSDMTDQPPGVTKLEYAYPCADLQCADPGSLLAYCRELNRIKKAHPSIARGENAFVYCDSFITIMKRTYGEEICYIAINFSPKETYDFPLESDHFTVIDRLNASDNVSGTGTEGENGPLTLSPYSIVILHEKL